MKKILLGFILLVTIMTSCQSGATNIMGRDSKVDITLQVTPPTMDSTRGQGIGLDSALGAIDNFNNNSELWDSYDLRYILEIYEVITNGSNTTISDTPIYKRQVLTTDSYDNKKVNFKMQVVPNRTYMFVVWADFVDDGESDDLYYNTANLRTISRKTGYSHTAMEEALDAYHISSTKEIKKSSTINLTLTRPMAKLRVVALDYNEISKYSTPTNVRLKFDTENNPVYSTFNALTNEISNNCAEHTYNYSIDPMPYQEYAGTNTNGESVSGLVLFSDYFFTPRNITENEKNEYPVSFSMTVIYNNNEEINHSVDFDTQIPLSRNYLTTVVGNCLTQKESFVIEVNDTLLAGAEITEN